MILRLYERHGDACVERLNGMFAFALWDPAAASCSSPATGSGRSRCTGPSAADGFVFGSEIKALLAHPGGDAEVDPDGDGPVPRESRHAGARGRSSPGSASLPPASAGTAIGRRARFRRYWDDDRRATPSGVPLERGTTTVRRELLEQSVEDRLMSDVPVGVLLSGGLDSTALVARSARARAGLPSFSVGFAGHPRPTSVQRPAASLRTSGPTTTKSAL